MTQERNKLRHFVDLDDLFDGNDNEVILTWVNKYADLILGRKEYHERRRKLQAAYVKAAKEMLAPDEREALEKQVSE